MIKKIFMFILLIALFMTSLNAKSIECEFKTGSCDPDEAALFYANKNFFPPGFPDQVLSSNVAIASTSEYNKYLCCYSPYGQMQVQYANEDENCPDDLIDLMYLTNYTNARTGLNSEDLIEYEDFNLSFYEKKVCVKVPVSQGSVKLIASKDDYYANKGYECLYKTSNITNGHVSSCDSTFNGGNDYNYTIWARIFESTNTLNCNSDCVSIATNRVSYDCKQKLDICKNVKMQCDGALLNSWVHYNETHEIKCDHPWNEFRQKMFTNDKLEVSSKQGNCDNLIGKKYSVIVNNEKINMKVYLCMDN